MMKGFKNRLIRHRSLSSSKKLDKKDKDKEKEKEKTKDNDSIHSSKLDKKSSKLMHSPTNLTSSVNSGSSGKSAGGSNENGSQSSRASVTDSPKILIDPLENTTETVMGVVSTPPFGSPGSPKSNMSGGSPSASPSFDSKLPINAAVPNSMQMGATTPTREMLDVDLIQTPKRQSSSRFEPSDNRAKEIVMLPDFEEVLPEEHRRLFLEKVDQCNIMCDFSDPTFDIRGKYIKKTTLEELIFFISTERITFTDEMYKHVIQMFRNNLFRPIPPPINPIGDVYEPDEDEPISELAWPHILAVFEFFLRFIELPDFHHQMAKQYIDHDFILRLLELFDSEDPKERDYLKTTLHRIYGKFLSLRGFIRKAINNVFLQFVYETERFNGIGELLEILGSIINGFALPMKEEHKVFLVRILIPLHKVKGLSLYHPQLAYCITQFLDKDPSLTEDVIMGLLRYWPKVNSMKELMFLNEVQDILDIIEPKEFAKVQIPLFAQLSKCISSTHFQVCEKVLCFWTKKLFLELVMENAEVVLPIVFASLYELANATQSNPPEKDKDKDGGEVLLDAKGNPVDSSLLLRDVNMNDSEANDEKYYDSLSSPQDEQFDEFTLLANDPKTAGWNRSIHQLAYSTLRLFMDHTPILYDHCLMLYHQSLEEQEAREKARKEGWKRIEEYVSSLKKSEVTIK